ncbi:MAG: helix-turn-helix domain-containing protein [Clostridiaceae bacterium]|jgi:excisionase family DNA binding protein|nr:helix-turn-helix domain-containing protein [Clostridiaceae bacterium]
MKNEVRICEKELLKVCEAAMLFNIGQNKLRELTSSEECPFVLFLGNRRLIKKAQFLKYLENEYSI